MLHKVSHPRSKTGAETKFLRYHPALVALHWISAVLILVALATGTFWLKTTPNSSPDKIAQLAAHMALGIAILVLTVGRVAVRNITPLPERANAGHVLLDRLAVATHYGLYAAIILMAVSGIVTAAVADLPAVVFGGSSARIIFKSSAPDCAWPLGPSPHRAGSLAHARRALSSPLSKRSAVATHVVRTAFDLSLPNP